MTKLQAVTWTTLIIAGVALQPRVVQAGALLPIKQDYQDYALSCEVATLKMALSWYGISASEDELMGRVGYDTTARRGPTWGDPNLGFVGNIRGRQNTTGYGVHWNPIARAARAYRPAQAYSWMKVTDLSAAIDAKQPVIIWGTYRGTAYADSWKTPAGKIVNAWFGEHTRLVIGYRGTAERPTHFILNDPEKGRITMTVAQLTANWRTFFYSGVVVR